MTPGGADEIWDLLRACVDPVSLQWLEDAVEAARGDGSVLGKSFPAVGRRVGREILRPDDSGSPGPAKDHDWTVDDAGRALLLLAVGDGAWNELEDLYRFGDAAERRAVLRSLPLLPAGDIGTDTGLRLVDDAVRTNDPRLIAAALNPYALERLDEDAFNQAVLKCVFVGVPLTGLEGLAERATPSLSRMLAGYVRERVAAGRDVPADVWPLVEAYPPHDELTAIEAELEHPVQSRREAAEAALVQRAEHRRPAAGNQTG